MCEPITTGLIAIGSAVKTAAVSAGGTLGFGGAGAAGAGWGVGIGGNAVGIGMTGSALGVGGGSALGGWGTAATIGMGALSGYNAYQQAGAARDATRTAGAALRAQTVFWVFLGSAGNSPELRLRAFKELIEVFLATK